MNKTADGLGVNAAQMRAANLRLIRHMTQLTVDELIKKYQADYKISASAWKGWEHATRGGLSRRGASIVTAICVKEGIFFHPDWLYYNIGSPPRFAMAATRMRSYASESFLALKQGKFIAEELSLFQQHYPEAIHMTVEDECMLPHFLPGDYVAGLPYTGQDIQKLIGQDCIVQTTDGRCLLRHLTDYQFDGSRAHLVCRNLNVKHTNIATEAGISFAAAVIWQRKQLMV